MSGSAVNAGAIVGAVIAGVIGLIFAIVMIAAAWKVFVKAGKPGWAAIVPIYNIVVFLEIVGKPTWWLVLLIIPLVSTIVSILLSLELAKVFGKTTGFGIGLFLFTVIFLPMLAFGDAQYRGVPQMAAPMPAY